MNRVLIALLACALSGAALAHHSFAMFDSDNQIKLTGKVKEFHWQNPHVYIHLMAPGKDGQEVEWTIECANPGILNRIGWKFNMIKEGDVITVIVASAAHRRAWRTAQAGHAGRRAQVRQWRPGRSAKHPVIR